MIAGRMNKKITIQEFEEDSPPYDSHGAPSGSWSTFATVWAEKVDQRGREFFTGGILSEITSLFRIRYLDNLTTKMRISYGGEYYDIKSMIEIGRREGYELVVTVQS